MGKSAVYFTTQPAYRTELLPGATTDKFYYHLVVAVKPVGQRKIYTTAPADPLPDVPFEFYREYMPRQMIVNLATFAKKHLQSGPLDYDCASFARFLTGTGPSEAARTTPARHYSSPASGRALKPSQHYMLMRGTAVIHSFIALANDYCLCVLGDSSQLIVTHISELLAGYGADRVELVESVELG